MASKTESEIIIINPSVNTIQTYVLLVNGNLRLFSFIIIKMKIGGIFYGRENKKQTENKIRNR